MKETKFKAITAKIDASTTDFGYYFEFPMVVNDETEQKRYEWDDLYNECFNFALDRPLVGDILNFGSLEHLPADVLPNLISDYGTAYFKVVLREVVLQFNPIDKDYRNNKNCNLWVLHLKPYCFV